MVIDALLERVSNTFSEGEMSSKVDVYSTGTIRVLSCIEAIRKRPGMYIGDVRDGSGLHHMLSLVVSEALAEHRAGRASKVRVSIEGQLAEVEDDGGGIPVELNPFGTSFVEEALTQLPSGPLGLVVVNALSEALEIEVRRDGWSWHQRFAHGVALGPLERGERTERTGTRVRFQADRSIFAPTPFDRASIRSRLCELAALNPTLTFELMTERIREPRGLLALVDALAGDSVDETFMMRSLKDDVLVEVALAWTRHPHTRVRSFVGQRETMDGGTHESGFWKGIAAAIGELPRRPSHVRRRLAGLTAIVHVDLPHPSFAGATWDRLANPEIRTYVKERVAAAYRTHLGAHPEVARNVMAFVRRTSTPRCGGSAGSFRRATPAE